MDEEKSKNTRNTLGWVPPEKTFHAAYIPRSCFQVSPNSEAALMSTQAGPDERQRNASAKSFCSGARFY